MDSIPYREDSIEHECHGDSAFCSFEENIMPAIKLSCDFKRFNQALKQAREHVNTSKCPKLITIFCSLSMKLNKSKEVLAYIEEIPTDLCIEIIDKFGDQSFSNFGIQKYLPKFLNLLLNSTVVRLLLTHDVHSSKLSKYLKLWIVRNINSDDFEKMFKKLTELPITNNHLFIMFDTLKDFNSGRNNYLILKWELFIRVINYDLNEYEFMKFNPECNENDLVDEEKNMSSRYLQLAELCYYNKPVQAECLLTAYSLNPTREIYNLIKGSMATNDLKLSVELSESQDKMCCTDLEENTLCDTCGEITPSNSGLQLNDNNRNILSNDCTEQIFSNKVFYVDGNVNGEDEDSLQRLSTDLITVLTAPRNKLITWELEWKTLNRNLLRLLKPQNKINLVKQYTSNANSKLKFLKLDYNKFRHLPEPAMPGIEKGYEAYLDSEYETTDEEVADNTKIKVLKKSLAYTATSEVAVLKIPEARNDLSDIEFSSSDSVELSIFDLIDNINHSKILSPIKMKKALSLENLISQSKEATLIPNEDQSLSNIILNSETSTSVRDDIFVFPLPVDIETIQGVYDHTETVSYQQNTQDTNETKDLGHVLINDSKLINSEKKSLKKNKFYSRDKTMSRECARWFSTDSLSDDDEKATENTTPNPISDNLSCSEQMEELSTAPSLFPCENQDVTCEVSINPSPEEDFPYNFFDQFASENREDNCSMLPWVSLHEDYESTVISTLEVEIESHSTIMEVENESHSTTLEVENESHSTTLEVENNSHSKDILATSDKEHERTESIETNNISDIMFHDSISTSETENKPISPVPQIFPTPESESVNRSNVTTDLTETNITSEIASENREDNCSILPWVCFHEDYESTVISTLEVENESHSTIMEVENESHSTTLEVENESHSITLEVENESHSTTLEVENESHSTTLEVENNSHSNDILATSDKEHESSESIGTNNNSDNMFHDNFSTSETENKPISPVPQIFPIPESESVNRSNVTTDLTETNITSEITTEVESDDNSMLQLVCTSDNYLTEEISQLFSELEDTNKQKSMEQCISSTTANDEPINGSQLSTDSLGANINSKNISYTTDSNDLYIIATSDSESVNSNNVSTVLTGSSSETEDMSLVSNISTLESETRPDSEDQHILPTLESVNSSDLVMALTRTNINTESICDPSNSESCCINLEMDSAKQLNGKINSKVIPPLHRTMDCEPVISQKSEINSILFLNEDNSTCIENLACTVDTKSKNELDSEHPKSKCEPIKNSLLTSDSREINNKLESILHPSISDQNCINLIPNQDHCEQLNGSHNFKSNNIQSSHQPLDTTLKKPSQDPEKNYTSILETTSTPLNNKTPIVKQNSIESKELNCEIENEPNTISDEDHFYPETLESSINDVRQNEINAWSPVAVAKPEEITEVIKFESPYYYDSDFCVGYEEDVEDDASMLEGEVAMQREESTTSKENKSSLEVIITNELKTPTRQEENNNFNAIGVINEKYRLLPDELVIGVFPRDNDETSEQTVFYDSIPKNLGPLKELSIILKPFIQDCCIPLKRLKLNPVDDSKTYKVTEVSNGHEFGFGNVIVLNDISVQKRILPSITLKPFNHSHTKKSNINCQIINLKKRKSSANNNNNCVKRPRVFDTKLQNSNCECDIDSNRISDEIQFKWATQTIKNYSRPKNKNFHKEGSYLKKYDKRCITPSSLLINSNLYNSTLNKAASKFTAGGGFPMIIKDSNVQKSSRKIYKKQAVFNNMPGLKTYEHLKISKSARNQSVNIIEVFNNNKSNCINNTINSVNNSANIVNTSNQTIETTTDPSTSGSVFHHFVQFNNATKANVIPHLGELGPGGISLQQTTPSAIKANSNIVQFLCKTDGKKIQLTPISNQRISHIQINRISNETNNQERENHAADIILPKFNQAFNSRTTTLDSAEQSGIPTMARSLPVLSKLQITPSRPVRISMPVMQKLNSTSLGTTTTTTGSRSIIQLPLRQLNQMSQNLGVSTTPRQVVITTASTSLNSVTPEVPTTTTDLDEVTTKSNSSNDKLDTSTLEQLREFDMVLEQVKERSISSCSNAKVESIAVTTTTNAPTSVIQKVNIRNVAFIQQKRSGNETPMVMLCGNNTKNRTLHFSTKKVVANTTKPTSVSSNLPPVAQITDNSTSPLSECPASTVSQKPPQKLQEDEQTIQRIYDILAEYAEQLRNSPDLKNKPAPRRRSNPTINAICTTSSQISNDNDSSSNSSITAAAPPSQIKHTINNNGENDINNTSSTVLLISPASRKSQLNDDRVTAVATRQILISDPLLPKVTLKNKTTISPTNTQSTLDNKFYPNNCIPLNMMMKRQQITILSGSKILTTLSSQQKSSTSKDPIILKTINSTNSIKNINSNTRSFPNHPSPIFVLSSPSNKNNKSSTEIMINSSNNDNPVIKNTTHTATSTTHSAITTSFNHNNNNKIIKESTLLEKEIKLQKSISEECEDLGVDEPSASELFPEADLLLDANPNSPIPTSSLDDDYPTDNHYFPPTTTLLQNKRKLNIETDVPSPNFSRNNNSGNKHINMKRVYGSSNWLRRYGNHTRKMIKLTNSSAPTPSLEITTSTSLNDHKITILQASKNILKRSGGQWITGGEHHRLNDRRETSEILSTFLSEGDDASVCAIIDLTLDAETENEQNINVENNVSVSKIIDLVSDGSPGTDDYEKMPGANESSLINVIDLSDDDESNCENQRQEDDNASIIDLVSDDEFDADENNTNNINEADPNTVETVEGENLEASTTSQQLYNSPLLSDYDTYADPNTFEDSTSLFQPYNRPPLGNYDTHANLNTVETVEVQRIEVFTTLCQSYNGRRTVYNEQLITSWQSYNNRPQLWNYDTQADPNAVETVDTQYMEEPTTSYYDTHAAPNTVETVEGQQEEESTTSYYDTHAAPNTVETVEGQQEEGPTTSYYDTQAAPTTVETVVEGQETEEPPSPLQSYNRPRLLDYDRSAIVTRATPDDIQVDQVPKRIKNKRKSMVERSYVTRSVAKRPRRKSIATKCYQCGSLD